MSRWTGYVCANGHRFTCEFVARFCAFCGTVRIHKEGTKT